MSVQLNLEVFQRHLKRLYASWKDGQGWKKSTVLAVPFGRVKDDIIYSKASSLHLWLLGYEFSDTILVFTETQLLVVSGTKKTDLMKQAEVAVGAAGLSLVLLSKPKDETGQAQMQSAIDSIKALGPDVVVGTLTEELSGTTAATWTKVLGESGLKTVDVWIGLANAMAPKDDGEVKNIKKAAYLVGGVMNVFTVPQVEEIIDGEKQVKHSKLAARIKKAVLEPSTVQIKLKSDLVDIAYPPILQSGGNFDLRLNVGGANNDHMTYDNIVCAVGARYSSYCASVGRTYFVDPSDRQTALYAAFAKAQAATIAALTDGVKLSSVYEAAVKSLRESGEEILVSSLGGSVGAGIGLELHDSAYELSATADAKAKATMAFTVQIAASGLDSDAKENEDKPTKFAVLLSDTVIVAVGGAPPEVITSAVSKDWKEIAYFLEGDDNADEQEANASAGELPDQELREMASRKSARTEQVDFKMREEERRRQKETQQDLLERVNAATLAALNVGGNGNGSGAGSGRKVSAIKTYSSPRDFAHNGLLSVQVDHKAEAVLAPIYGHLVPFHVLTIKNASMNQEGEHAYIRINFNLGGSYEPSLKFPNQIFLKELSFRSSDPRHATKVVQEIKTLRSLVLQRERETAERATLVVQERLVRSKGRVYALPDVWIRPGFGGRGRRVTGTLEAHHNGFRYVAPRGDELDVMYRNIKHAFFQPAEKEMITLVHFHLHNPIMVGKKKTHDVQFYTEVMDSVQTLEAGRRSAYDPDEIEDEQRERERRNSINRSFQQFVKRVQTDVWERDHGDLGLEFEVPFRELGFDGVPARSTCFIMPTVNCLVELTEMPFTVITLAEVNLVNLERVGFNLRNFDMVFIWKDLNREVGRIDAVQSTSLDTIKDWLASMEIKYYESKVNLNWRNIIKSIKEDPEGFIADGGWNFLDVGQSDSEEEEAEQESEFEPSGDDEESEESESSEDESLVDSDEDEEPESEDEEEEEGLNWDELEAEAIREDKEHQYSDDEEERSASRKRRGGSSSRDAPKKSRR